MPYSAYADRSGDIWIEHYSSSHNILLVGEGNFSFATSLAEAFGSASNIFATSLDTESDLISKHPSASDNLEKLRDLGCTILHQVDASTMSRDHRLRFRSFDRIVFNFPHAGFFYGERNTSQIELHQEVVKGFLRNARTMLSRNGEVHVTHKTSYPYNLWEIVNLAEEVGLHLIEEAYFSRSDYPGYINKRGSGYKSDRTFKIGLCSTFKFSSTF